LAEAVQAVDERPFVRRFVSAAKVIRVQQLNNLTSIKKVLTGIFLGLEFASRKISKATN
jgi:hypothetical protein